VLSTHGSVGKSAMQGLGMGSAARESTAGNQAACQHVCGDCSQSRMHRDPETHAVDVNQSVRQRHLEEQQVRQVQLLEVVLHRPVG
jgi:hypothetical protein